ncbi:MAG TPA: helix-turn-helix domain-containing protein [Nocardioidaceae bacterium]|nr:helix-turn-helix domain-containing protein [Nocardioidaceae bacterium]
MAPTESSTDDRARGLGPTRARVLALLQDAGEPLTADDVATRMALHANTARFHLEALESGGLAVRTTEARRTPGRPRALFTAAPGVAEVGHRSYRLLAQILTGYLANRLPDPQQSAVEAGSAWGRFLAAPPAPFHEVDAQEAVEALVVRLGSVGFESHAAGEGDQLRLEVNHCPFLELAEDNRDVICSVHLGLMRGLLEQMQAPVAAESLEPLVEPSRCIARLRALPA